MNCLTFLLTQMFNCPIFFTTAKEVAKLLSSLEASKAVGSDKIPVVIIKNLIPELAPILSKLFNCYIKKGCFLQYWKKSSVCPVFKNSGQCNDPCKYPPISLLLIISKVFEFIINYHIIHYLEKHDLLSNNQYDFQPL